MTDPISLSSLQALTAAGDLADKLGALSGAFPGQVVFSTSFSLEDQVITHAILHHRIPIDLFTLDTGRLFPETYGVWSRTVEKYGPSIRVYYPEAGPLEHFVADKGPNAFYASVEDRKRCCHLRKVEPLQRAVRGYRIWITGIRAAHSPNRTDMSEWEWDETHQLFKYHPLFHARLDEVTAVIRDEGIPFNNLFEKGFASIGCAPCTRAVRPGEDPRAGRWWWEENSKKECGLHSHEKRTDKL